MSKDKLSMSDELRKTRKEMAITNVKKLKYNLLNLPQNKWCTERYAKT